MERTPPKQWKWDKASGSALARSLIELLSRKEIITVEEMSDVLDERLSSDHITKGEVPEPLVDLREPLQKALETNIALLHRLAATEFVVTTLLACQDEDMRLRVREAATKSLKDSPSAGDENFGVIQGAVSDIIERALSAER